MYDCCKVLWVVEFSVFIEQNSLSVSAIAFLVIRSTKPHLSRLVDWELIRCWSDSHVVVVSGLVRQDELDPPWQVYDVDIVIFNNFHNNDYQHIFTSSQLKNTKKCETIAIKTKEKTHTPQAGQKMFSH